MINNFAENKNKAFLSDKFFSSDEIYDDNDSIIKDPQHDDDVDDNGGSAVLACHDNPII